MTFDEFGLHENILEAIEYMGFKEATPIQEQAIPKILAGKDLIACAQTGTGKTASFMLPVLHKLASKNDHVTNTLVVAPTRELAIQIEQQIQGFSYFAGVSSIAIYGGGDGSSWGEQKNALQNGCDIIVATPGKLISHLNLKNFDFSGVQHLILDEADRMLDMGFRDDIKKIVSCLPKKRQTLMFSATMPPKIRELAKMILKDPEQISLEISKPAEGVLQGAYLVYDSQKVNLVNQLIKDKPNYKRILVFTKSKKSVFDIARTLRKTSKGVEGISSDLDQREREEVLGRFRSKKTRILVATDVLSRGIDIADINLVINYDVPDNAEDYVHRIGRTARADTTGVALTLINQKDMPKFKDIETLIESEVNKIPLPPDLGEGPDWNPNQQRQSRFNNKRPRKNGKKRYSGNKKFGKKKSSGSKSKDPRKKK